MLALIQRVNTASVSINNEIHASISEGLLIFIGLEATDTLETTLHLLNRCFNYRIFSDSDDKMNLSLNQCKREALIVPQFTLVADTKRGLRPSFSKGMPPKQGKSLFSDIIDVLSSLEPNVSFGAFGDDMKINLCNDGPVTFLLSTN